MATESNLRKLGISVRIANSFRRADIVSQSSGRIGVTLLRLSLAGKTLYMKRACDWLAVSELEHEAAMLALLNSQLRIPKIVEFERDQQGACLVMEAVSGLPAHDDTRTGQVVLSEMLDVLELIRGIRLERTQVAVGVDEELKHIKRCLRQGEVDRQAFATANQDRTPEEVFDEIAAMNAEQSADTFTHGDLCLPNIILGDEAIGVIDWGKAGWGDPMRDIYSMVGSVRRNLGDRYAHDFWDEATRNLDGDLERKLRFYSSIDQFFYCRLEQARRKDP